ncbi:MAG: methyltransferase domain-containing protein [Candidatus Saganbacteria bacterium]|nr:methyltransferase domain-containing protein [Candidatus Saganbacteria bacterium]
MQQEKIRLNIGCGNDIRPGYINCDKVAIEGVDKAVDLDARLPFEDNSVNEIVLIDVLEHVQDFIGSMEELCRILEKNGRLIIQVPYWNSWCAVADPTHRRGFHEKVFNFFDPDREECRERHYYTKARFRIISLNPVLYPFSPSFRSKKREIKNKLLKKAVFFLGNYLNNIIIDLSVILEKA